MNLKHFESTREKLKHIKLSGISKTEYFCPLCQEIYDSAEEALLCCEQDCMEQLSDAYLYGSY